jgi:hypothetical protein
LGDIGILTTHRDEPLPVARTLSRQCLVQGLADGWDCLPPPCTTRDGRYAERLDVIRAWLPERHQRDRDDLRVLAEEPPDERVGLELFTPPEYRTEGRR